MPDHASHRNKIHQAAAKPPDSSSDCSHWCYYRQQQSLLSTLPSTVFSPVYPHCPWADILGHQASGLRATQQQQQQLGMPELPCYCRQGWKRPQQMVYWTSPVAGWPAVSHGNTCIQPRTLQHQDCLSAHACCCQLSTGRCDSDQCNDHSSRSKSSNEGHQTTAFCNNLIHRKHAARFHTCAAR